MGSSGGGGSSGAVSHAAYLEGVHGDWLNNLGLGTGDQITTSITAVMNAALGHSPWTSLSAYDPGPDIIAYETEMATFAAMLAGLSDTVDWAAFYAQAELTIDGFLNAHIIADIEAFENQLDDNITTRVLPRFRRGMQDINAVVSSAFAIGESVIEAFQARDVAKYASALYLSSDGRKLTAVDQMLQMMARRVGWEESYARMFVDAKRIKIVAMKEQIEGDAAIDEADAKWDLEVFQYGSNLLASIGGGTAMPNMPGKNKTASAIGGAMSGAAMGAMIGGGVPGAVIGGVLGAAMGLLG